MSAAPFVFEYEIGEVVLVVPIELKGTVIQRTDRGGGVVSYQVVYWCESRRCVEWLEPQELKAPVRTRSERRGQ